MNNLFSHTLELTRMLDFAVAQRILANMDKLDTVKEPYQSPKRDKVCSSCGQQQNWCSCNVTTTKKKDEHLVYKLATRSTTCVRCGQLYQWCNC